MYNNLRNVDVVKGSLLDYAKNVNAFENVITGEPTTDIPDSARYCIAHIMYRANSWFISIEGRDNRLYMNYNNGTNWTGWNSTALKSDLISIDDQWYVRFREITSDVPITGQVTLDYWYIPAQ